MKKRTFNHGTSSRYRQGCRCIECREANKLRTRRYANHSRYAGFVSYDHHLEEQNGVCGICAREPRPGKLLHVDHDHDTMKFRGLLCSKCNQALGVFGDNESGIKRALDYLRKP